MLFEKDDCLGRERSVDFLKAFALTDRGTDLYLSQRRHHKASICIATEKTTHPLSPHLGDVELHDSARIQEIETQGLSPVTYDSRGKRLAPDGHGVEILAAKWKARRIIANFAPMGGNVGQKTDHNRIASLRRPRFSRCIALTAVRATA